MATTPVIFTPVTLATTASAPIIYTCPVATTAVITNIDLNNLTATAATCDVHLVRSGGSPSASNSVIYVRSVAARMNLPFVSRLALTAGDTIRARSATANAINIIINGVEST